MNRLKLAVVLFLLLPFALSVASAQDSIPRDETVIFEHAQSTQPNFENYNWMVPGSVLRAAGLQNFLMEPLFMLNLETGEIEGWQGESMTANETLDVWTLSIREGVTWADGEAFNADDVVFTIELLKENAPALVNSASIDRQVESVEKIDDLTVQFNLTAPNPRFQLDNFSVRVWQSVVMLPEHVWRDKDPLTFTYYDPEQGWPLGTGAYTLADTSETEFVFDRNDDWWGATSGFTDLPAPRRIIYILNQSEERRAALAVNDEVDVTWDMGLGTYQAIKAQNPNWITWNDDPLQAWMDTCARGFVINTIDEPWSNPELREAINQAVDRDEVNLFAFDGITVASRSMYPEYEAMFPYINAMVDEGLTFSATADPDRARELIEGAGYTLNNDGFYEMDGEVLSINIQALEATPDRIRMIEVVVEQLRRVGIDATMQRLTNTTLWENRDTGNFEALDDGASCGSVNEPVTSLERFTGNLLMPQGERASGNYGRWQGDDAQRYTEIVSELATLPLDDERVIPLTVEAQTIWREAVPYIPLVNAKFLLAFNTTYWQNWPTADNNYFQPAFWWNSAHRIVHEIEPAQ